MNEYQESLNAALQMIDKALKKNSFNLALLAYKGYLLDMIKRDQEALDCFGMALAFSPDCADAYWFRSWFYFDRFQYDLALEDITKTIELAVPAAKLHCQKGNILRKLRRYPEAIEEYSRAIALNPEHKEALFERGYLYRECDQTEKSEADLTLARTIDRRERAGIKTGTG